MKITNAQRMAIADFVNKLEGSYTLEQYQQAGQFWAKDSTVWRFIHQGGTGQLRLVCWHNFTHKPGSQEWRPAVIIQAVLAHVGLPYSTAIFLQEPAPAATAANMQALLEDELDNMQIQEELIIPFRPFLSGKIATTLNEKVFVDSHY